MFLYVVSDGGEEETCTFKGEEFKARDKLVTKDCKYRCSCKIEDDTNKKYVSCKPLCSEYKVACKIGEIIAYKSETVEQSNCTCMVPVCEKKGMVMEIRYVGYLKKGFVHNNNYFFYTKT